MNETKALGTLGGVFVREWDVETWQARTLTTIGLSGPRRYWMDDAFSGGQSRVALGSDAGWMAFRLGRNEPLAVIVGPLAGRAPAAAYAFAAANGLAG